ncbi:putative metallopeptidase [Acinetobacter sp. YH01025]|uniref:putative metallopeptidase n=1 Tax=Acinetobacter sp. YH01025 TaxID=2601038 RepID=UPI0015D17A62|nr:putative metallopeptidase [Acinetobacter sp. YH01025]
MINEVGQAIPVRPYPPKEIFDLDTPNFIPAPELWAWIKAVFLNEHSEVFNPDHIHLDSFYWPQIAVMWANGGFIKQGRFVVGQAEKVMINVGGWKKARQEEQFEQWFGQVPEYLITVDAKFAQVANDIAFCALVEHELYHIAHKRDEWGIPQFNRETGLPKLEIKGHDVEEFTGVVRRYGASEEVQTMIDAAKQRPEISRADIYHACGTCFLKVV